MDYEPTEAQLNGLSGDEMAADEAQAAFYEQEAAAGDVSARPITTTSKSSKGGTMASTNR